MQNALNTERRAHPRYDIKGHAVAFNSNLLGQINNISMGGLLFKYAAKDENIKDTSEIDIFITGDAEFYLERVPVRIVDDNPIKQASPFSTIVMRNRRLQFGELSPNQKSKLEYFIEKYTHAAV